MGLFVVTGVFQTTGYGDQAVAWLAHAGVDLHVGWIQAVVTAALSNLISNSAAVMLLVNVVDVSHAPQTTAYILALANSFGGSLIITGSVSNIIVVQQARENGIEISFLHFLRLGVPITVVALLGVVAWAHLWSAEPLTSPSGANRSDDATGARADLRCR